jgi:hypothetical protein
MHLRRATGATLGTAVTSIRKLALCSAVAQTCRQANQRSNSPKRNEKGRSRRRLCCLGTDTFPPKHSTCMRRSFDGPWQQQEPLHVPAHVSFTVLLAGNVRSSSTSSHQVSCTCCCSASGWGCQCKPISQKHQLKDMHRTTPWICLGKNIIDTYTEQR